MRLLVSVAMTAPGCQPEHIAVRQARSVVAGHFLGMVVDNATRTATVFDADTNTILGTVPGLAGWSGSGDCSITPDGKKGFFTSYPSSVTAVDLTTTPPTLAGAPNPIGISNPGEDTALEQHGKFLVICDGSTIAPVSVIDVATQTQIDSFDTGSYCTSVDVCRGGSVLITTPDSVRRLTLSSSGVLTDTGESLAARDPTNVYCSLNGIAGLVVERAAGRVTSFQTSGMTPLSFRVLPDVISGALNRADARVYFRASMTSPPYTGSVSAFTFDEWTGVLGAVPFFPVEVAPAPSFRGVDQLAVHPWGASLYIPEPGALRILDAITGAEIGSIASESMSQITGVCIDSNRPPIAVCGGRRMPAGSPCVGLDNIDNGSSDPDNESFECEQIPDVFPFGQSTVTLICTDPSGKSSSCTAEVSVEDSFLPPSITCPADQTVECSDGHGGATATFTPTAIDNCDTDLDISCAPPSGSTFPVGTTAGICRADDDFPNAAFCTHNVTVVDTAPPTVIATDAGSLWPPDHGYRRIDLDDCIASIQDACGGALDMASHAAVTCCTSDEPDTGLGGGDLADDCVIVDSDSVDVRAERRWSGDGRVYTIHYTVTDGSNNATHHTCTVSVPHSQGGGPAVDDGPQTTCP